VTVRFDDCEYLGAANLRGTGFAVLDHGIQELTADSEVQGIPVGVLTPELKRMHRVRYGALTFVIPLGLIVRVRGREFPAGTGRPH